jgi:hypothetical protein
MKSIRIYFAMLVFLVFSCSKEDLQNAGQNSDQILTNATLKCAGTVIKVLPSGTDDTQAILNAFAQAKAAGPGSVVQLVAGIYKIGLIRVSDFTGYFRGAGKGRTIITNLPNLPQGDVFASNSIYPALLMFIGGNLSMSDMTIHINDGNAVATPDPIGDLYCILWLADNSTNHIPPIHYIKAAVDNVDFIAGYDGGTGFSPFSASTKYNVWSSIMISLDDQWGLTPALCDVSITHCKMENDIFGTWIWGLDNGSSVNIENNQFIGGEMQILAATCLGSNVKIRNNQFQKGSFYDLFIDSYNWLWISEQVLSVRSHFTVTGNNFQSQQGVTSLTMNDARRPLFPNEGFPQLLDVMGNSFKTQDGGMAIQGLNNVDAKIWNNKFSGTGVMGVSIDGDAATSTYAENISLLGNLFFAATYTDASVYLGPYSKNCKVVGVSADNVVDNGVNNTVLGAKPHKGSSGPGHHTGMDFSSIHERMGRWNKR